MAIELASIRSFHVGGAEISVKGLPVSKLMLRDQPGVFTADQNGQYEVGQLYAQAYSLAHASCRWPVLFWHGGGLTGAVWEATASGREGWLGTFLRAGFHVIVSDAMGLGRSSWGPDPTIYPNQHFRSKRELWELLRLGRPGTYHPTPSARYPFDGQQFPVALFDHFAKRTVPRWIGNEPAMQAAYDALVDEVGPCIIVAHSSATRFAINAAARRSDLIKSIVAVEPSVLPPFAEAQSEKLHLPPCLVLFGDYLEESPYWSALSSHLRDRRRQMDAEVELTWIDLPHIGISGNSHCPMVDENAPA
jgi:pimeloyl-ACP methyl ester carboxylesterase